MNSEVSPEKTDGGLLRLLRTVALIAVLVGAVGSVGFTLRAGQRNPSRLLIVLFVIWVLSPFAAMVFVKSISRDWSVLARATVYIAMVVLSLASLAIYGRVALGPPRVKTAFVFVIIPPLSWLLMIIAVSVAALISRKSVHLRDRG